jgi:hypothetical protein
MNGKGFGTMQSWKQFADLYPSAQEIRLFENPFDCDAADVKSNKNGNY